MSRPLLFRSLATLPVLLCAFLWIFSQHRLAYLHRISTHGVTGAAVNFGALYFVRESFTATGPVIWDFKIKGTEPRPDSAPFYYFGFNGGLLYSSAPLVIHFLRIPLWFPTTLSVLVLWLTWRKTLPRPKLAAFPVQPVSAQSLSQ